MCHDKKQGFTIPEILVVLTAITVLAAILIPMLLNPRKRAFDVVAQACLKEVSTRQLVKSTQDPFQYDPTFNTASVYACNDVIFTKNTNVAPNAFTYEAKHNLGANTYSVSAGTGVVKVN